MEQQHIDKIQQIIREDNLTSQSPGLGGVLVRAYQTFLENRNKLSLLDNTQLAPQDFSQELQQLSQQKETLAREVASANQSLEEARSREKQNLDHLQQELSLKENQSSSLVKECRRLQDQLDEWNTRPQEKERLKHLRNTLRATSDELQQKINVFDETALGNQRSIERMRPVVEGIEDIEATMDNLMKEIWGQLKKDAFDRIF